ncbi:hypothetical protein ABZ312_23720 [Streptomyces sp. NPDC006207]
MAPALALAERPAAPAAPVLVGLSPTRTTPDPDAVELVADVDALLVGTLPGCSDDNPYN